MTFTLRKYQKEASDCCFNDLKENNKLCIVLPTGAGKTEIFIDITAKYLKENPVNSVLILSHLSILTGQTKNRFKLRHPDIKIGILKYGNRPHYLDDVIIGTMQSSSHKERMKGIDKRLVKKIGLIIVDEAHFIHTNSYQKLLSYFPNAKLVGCTATPFKQNKLMTNFFDKVSYSMSLGELIEIGYLVPPKLIQIGNKSDSLEDKMTFIVSTYIKKEIGTKAIIFMRTIKEAETMRNVFIELGINCEAITSKITGESRDERLKEFNEGSLDVLTTVDVLSTGFDSPPVSAIFQPFPTKSVTKYLQRIGRGLRPHAQTAKQDCRIYVYGSAPNICRGLYERIQNLALNANGEHKIYDTYTDEWEFNDQNPKSEIYEWNQTVINVIRKFNQFEMNSLSTLMNNKKFPKRFMDKIDLILDRLPLKSIKIPHGNKPINNNQLNFLIKFSFPDNVVKNLTRHEANMMIKVIKGKSINNPFMITKGRYEGYHVSELPFSYRSYIVSNYPSSCVAKIIISWNNKKISA